VSVIVGLLFGLIVLGPLACWWLGMFNPLGYMGVRPWDVPEEALRRCAKHGRRNCFCTKYYGGEYQ